MFVRTFSLNSVTCHSAIIAWTALSTAALLTSPARAADEADSDPPAAGTNLWHGSYGVGAIGNPTYQGSDRSVVRALPFGHLEWNDRISIGYEGVEIHWHHDALSFGGGLTWDFGRSDHSGSYFFNSGDDRLKGLTKINASLGGLAFVGYRIANVDLTLSGSRFDGALKGGVLVKLGASVPIEVSPQLTISPHIGGAWANTTYTETYFGVTASEAANSSFSQFTATAGVRDIEGGIDVQYRINQHWFVTSNATVERFEGDAARSPITLARSNTRWVTIIGYRY